MEKILKIEEVDNFKKDKDDYDSFSGYMITTDEQVIKICISSQASCCEQWGYFSSDDDLDKYIGAELLDIKITDTERNTTKLKEEVGEYGVEEGDLMFIDLETSKGVLQFTLYNVHNGYYGHAAFIKSKQLSEETTL